MGITIRQQQYQDTHTNYFQYIHLRNTINMQNATKTSAQRLFRYTARSASMAAPSVKQSEFLKNNPVPGITSWYETSVENNQIFTKRLHLQEIASGKVTEILLDPNFPEILPEAFRGLDAENLKAFTREWNSNNQQMELALAQPSASMAHFGEDEFH